MTSETLLFQRISELPVFLKEHLLDYVELLSKRNFKIEKEAENKLKENQKKKINKMFKEIQKLNIFNQITDPVEWQKNQRDEWENRTIG